ncbi:MAG TPA: metalloregulator ArsR/SmtB family transcription factor [Dehalococcoidia bacterium]|nr:metalloregulator ArsR/SmtB family transcription factor [Dehalococcoidia bacterium]
MLLRPRVAGYHLDVRRFDRGGSLLLALAAARQPRLGRLPALLRVQADPTRLRIAGLLAQRELCVCDLEALLGVSQSMASHHLGVLRQRRGGRHDGAAMTSAQPARYKVYHGPSGDFLRTPAGNVRRAAWGLRAARGRAIARRLRPDLGLRWPAR